MTLRELLKPTFTKHLLTDIAGSIYETVTFQNFTQRLIRRKVGNVFRRLKGQPSKASYEDCRRMNKQAARSI